MKPTKFEDIKVGEFYNIVLERGSDVYTKWMVIFKNPSNSTVVCAKIRTLQGGLKGKYEDEYIDIEVLDGVKQVYATELTRVTTSYNNEPASVFDCVRSFKFIINSKDELDFLVAKYGPHKLGMDYEDKIKTFPYYFINRTSFGTTPDNVSKEQYDNDVAIPFKITESGLEFDSEAKAGKVIVGNEIIVMK
ncbi:hypothetical protein HYQ22_gp152 [Acinetobacter phage vB_AbaM_Kimel]|uniref:Uncharacterized protein n=1 Tax=Acinetobacter phage vB_AbaM_Kimel TaxID=2686303 RepID=A0A6B9M276_9CAUD|nr:hypothetical protein HYQ22_gp152 [Acinetobacter phage vB_AbaM_Kimel]QHB48399.1 hypothetical protein Kimel_244 [Acinetobacter phage vB_AbaM_Kimel]